MVCEVVTDVQVLNLAVLPQLLKQILVELLRIQVSM
jgi:hypothetical protein